MTLSRVRRAQSCVALGACVVGVLAILYSGFDFTGAGERALVQGDSYFVSSLFSLNALGGMVLVVAGVAGLVAALQGSVVAAALGAAISAFGGLVVVVGNGNAETLFGQGNPSNAAVFLIVAFGLAVTEWAAAVDT